MDDFDLKLSRKMKKLIQRVDRLAEHEMGERIGIGLVLFPFTREGEEPREANYQYASNCHVSTCMVRLSRWSRSGMPACRTFPRTRSNDMTGKTVDLERHSELAERLRHIHNQLVDCMYELRQIDEFGIGCTVSNGAKHHLRCGRRPQQESG